MAGFHIERGPARVEGVTDVLEGEGTREVEGEEMRVEVKGVRVTLCMGISRIEYQTARECTWKTCV